MCFLDYLERLYIENPSNGMTYSFDCLIRRILVGDSEFILTIRGNFFHINGFHPVN